MAQKSVKGKAKSPATSFLIMAAANFAASFVFGILWLAYTSDDGSRQFLFLVAAGVSMLSGIIMIVLYGYFQKKLEDLKKSEKPFAAEGGSE